MKQRRNIFTLIEIVIAIAIMSMVVLSTLVLSGGALFKSGEALEIWRDTHKLVQAAEYYLTMGPDAGGISSQFFPYNDCQASCNLESVDNPPNLQHLEEKVDVPARELRRLHITLYWPRSAVKKPDMHLTIDKLIFTGKEE